MDRVRSIDHDLRIVQTMVESALENYPLWLYSETSTRTLLFWRGIWDSLSYQGVVLRPRQKSLVLDLVAGNYGYIDGQDMIRNMTVVHG